MSSGRKTAGQRARSLAKRAGRRTISAVLPLISQAVEEAAAEGLFRTDVVLDGRWFLDETNQRDLRKALRVENLDSANPRINTDGQFVLSVLWGDYPLEDSEYGARTVVLKKSLILVTNASGLVGKATLKALEAHSDLFNIRATSRSPSRELSQQFPKVEWVYADLNTLSSVVDATSGVTKVVHIPPTAESSVRTAQSQNVATAAAQNGVQHIVDISAIGANSRACYFHNALRDQEEAFEAGDVPWTHLRASWFFENFLLFASQSIKGANAFYFPLGDAAVSAVSVRDVGQVAATLITRAGAEGLTVNLTGPESATGASMAQILSEELERAVEYHSPNEEMLRNTMKSQNAPEWLVDGLWELYVIIQGGGAAKVSSDIKRLLGDSATTFRQFVRANLSSF